MTVALVIALVCFSWSAGYWHGRSRSKTTNHTHTTVNIVNGKPVFDGYDPKVKGYKQYVIEENSFDQEEWPS